MSREKQIEEMAEVLKKYTKERHIMASRPILEGYAEALYEVGYCKASDVAREIFAEIETVLCYSVYPRINANGAITPKRSNDFHIRCDDYNALKKKYTEAKND